MTLSNVMISDAPGVQSAEIAGRTVVRSYGDPAREYESLRTGAMLVDRGARLRMTFAGPQMVETLTGILTNDVGSLLPGDGQFAAALTPKGKIVADVRIFRQADRILVDVPPRAADGWLDLVRKFVNPRLARYTDVSDSLSDIGLFGAQSRRIASELTGISAAALQALPLYSHLTTQHAQGPVIVARVPDAGLEGYEFIASPDVLRTLWNSAIDAGATPGGLEAWDIVRIEAGRPEWGVDISDSTLPQEANLDDLHAISYTKGCYTGQETVARIHFRGHVNRHLRGLRSTAPEPLPMDAQLVDGTGKAVGDVRSSTLSPRLGNIAIAMVRREVEPGSTVDCRWQDGGVEVTVWALPFPL